jgi:hypothetical protein
MPLEVGGEITYRRKFDDCPRNSPESFWPERLPNLAILWKPSIAKLGSNGSLLIHPELI